MSAAQRNKHDRNSNVWNDNNKSSQAADIYFFEENYSQNLSTEISLHGEFMIMHIIHVKIFGHGCKTRSIDVIHHGLRFSFVGVHRCLSRISVGGPLRDFVFELFKTSGRWRLT